MVGMERSPMTRCGGAAPRASRLGARAASRRLGLRVLVSTCFVGCGGQSAEVVPCSGAPICAAVADAIDESAFCDVRLTGFRYSPSRGALTGEERERLSGALAKEVTPARFMALRSGTARDRHAAGVLRIIECVVAPKDGATEACNAGVEILEEVVESSPDVVGPRNDLAVARWLAASRSEGVERRIAALEDVTRAVEQDPGSAEAVYNLARIQEDLALWRQAAEGYERHMERDWESGWGRESGTRRVALAALDPGEAVETVRRELQRAVENVDGAEIDRLVSSNPQLVRELAQDELLIRWARETEAAGTSSLTPGLLLVGLALVAASDDYTVADTLSAASQAARVKGLVRRISAYGRALTYLSDLDYESALPLLLTATASVDPSDHSESPLVRWAKYYLAREAYQRSDYEAAFVTTERLLRIPDSSRYPALLVKVLRLQALMYCIRGDCPRARDQYLQAARLAHSAGELGAYADQEVSLTRVLHELGDQRGAWRAFGEALGLRGHLASPIGQYRLFNAAAVNLRDEERPWAARWFQAEAVGIAEESGNPALLVEAYRELAAIEEAAGNIEAALEALARSSDHAGNVRSPSVGRFLDLENQRRAGLLLVDVNSEAAAERLTRAIEASTQIGYLQVLPKLYLARAEAWLSVGRNDLAEDDLQQAMQEVESQTQQISLPEYKISFSAQTRQVYERLVMFELDQGRAARAFAAADRPRDRLLQDLLLDRGEPAPDQTNAAEPFGLTAERVAASLDEATALVEFALVESRALVWSFKAGSMRFQELPSTAADLRASVDRLQYAAERRFFSAADRELAHLFDVLIAPLDVLTPGINTLIVVPHDELSRVPFSSLIDRRRGNHLINDVRVVISPSAAASANARFAPRDFNGKLERALIVADPTFDQVAFPALPRLPFSLQEATRVARVYGSRSRVLTGNQATRAAFFEEAPHSSVLHIASHFVSSLNDPLEVGVVLAASPGSPSAVTARDLLDLDLRSVRLVVLSTCGSATGPIVADGGTQSLALVFLAAGAQAVIASSWRVDDEKMSDVMKGLHLELGQHPTIPAAFQAWKTDSGDAFPEALQSRGAFELYAPR